MFSIVEHVIPCQFVRENPRATAHGHETGLSLAVKQYTPTQLCDPSFSQVTIIGAHGNAFPKELYEPLWEELHDALLGQRIAIQSIWMADAAHQGQSGLLNETKLGNDPSLFDHSRDLIAMINHFQAQMTLPIIGVAHSMGAPQLIHAALTHPRLFHALTLIEPVLYDKAAPPTLRGPAHGAALRRDRWPSRAALAAYVQQSKLYASWDPRCRDRWMRYGVRDVPAPSGKGTIVTLVTTKHQEAFTLTRPTYLSARRNQRGPHWGAVDEAIHSSEKYALVHAEPIMLFHNLKFLRPGVLYMYGALSDFLKHGGMRKRAIERTGAGILGSGGVEEGRVVVDEIEAAGHMAPVEQPGIIARKLARWVAREVDVWKEEQQVVVREWRGKKGIERRMLDDEFLTALGLKGKTRAAQEKL